MSYRFLLILCVILASTKVLGLLTGKLHLPQVVGSLLAGLILGPAVLNMVQPNEFLGNLAELGVVVIMFSAGMDTSVDELKESGRSGLMVACMGVFVPLALGVVLLRIFEPSAPLLSGVFFGTVLTATSVSITVETLKEIGKLSTKVGHTILAAALIDDILGLICLTIVTSLAGAGVSLPIVLLKIVLFFVFVAVVGWLFIKFIDWYDIRVHDRNLHRFPVACFVLCLFMAWSAETIFGVADIIGSFAAGMIVAMTPKGTYTQNKITPLSFMLLTPIFFANIGLKVALSDLSPRMMVFAVALLATAILSKLLGCGFGAKVCGFDVKQCSQIGFGMACRGEVALIVCNKGISMGVLHESFACPIILMVICCAVLTPILLKGSFAEEHPHTGLLESSLVDRFMLKEQMDIAMDYLIKQNNAYMGKKK